MRLFVAINLPEEVRLGLHDATAPLREEAPHVSWVAPSKLHLTVKFLGERPESMLDAGGAALREVAARHRPFDLEVGGLGAFPNLRGPSVVWVGIAPDPRLELLHHDVELAFQQLGCGLDGRPFRPHVTLGRVRHGGGRDEAKAVARAVRTVTYRAEAPVRSLDLMQSALAAAGAHYTLRHAAELGAQPSLARPAT